MTFHTSEKRYKITFNSYNYNFFLSIFLIRFSLKLSFQLITFRAFREHFGHLDDDMNYEANDDVTTFKKQDGGQIALDT